MPTASDRVRDRIAEWVEREGHGSQRRLARAVSGKFGEPKSDQWISDILNKRADLVLRDLDAVADVLDVPPGWLVRGLDRNYDELTMAESKILRFYRGLPDTVRAAWLMWLEYVFSYQEATLTKVAAKREQKTQQARRHESAKARMPYKGEDRRQHPRLHTAHDRGRRSAR
jgi:transcriptional regulator with XRE-family HTH domain